MWSIASRQMIRSIINRQYSRRLFAFDSSKSSKFTTETNMMNKNVQTSAVDYESNLSTVDSQKTPPTIPEYMIAVRGCPTSVTESEIVELFAPIAVTNVFIGVDTAPGVPFYAYAEFANEDDMTMALRNAKRHIGMTPVWTIRIDNRPKRGVFRSKFW